MTSHYLEAKPQTPLTVAVRAGIYGLTSKIPKVIGLAPTSGPHCNISAARF